MGVIDFAHYPYLWERGPDKDEVRHKSLPRGRVLRTPSIAVRPALTAQLKLKVEMLAPSFATKVGDGPG